MAEYAPSAIKKLFDAIHAGIPGANNAGILGDKAHTYGYHRGRNYVGGSDYSVQYAQDKKGDGEAASALDLTWDKAQLQYDVSKRLLNAKNDSRMNVVRSFFGSTDGQKVCGWDYTGNYAVSSDDSHLWHVHISIHRQYATNWDALAPVADVIIGKSTSGGGGGGGDDDMPKRLQVRREDVITVNKASEVWELKWDTQDFDTGNIFYGSGKPNPDTQAGSWIATGIPNGAAWISTFACLVKKLPEGKEFWSGLSWCDQDGQTTGGSAWLETANNGGGNLYVVDTRTGYNNDNRGLKVRVQTPVQPIEIHNALWTVMYWPG